MYSFAYLKEERVGENTRDFFHLMISLPETNEAKLGLEVNNPIIGAITAISQDIHQLDVRN